MTANKIPTMSEIVVGVLLVIAIGFVLLGWCLGWFDDDDESEL